LPFEFAALDVKQIRERYDLSQSEFAALLGVSIKTLPNWEQGRRSPQGCPIVSLRPLNLT
jgi:putative transcriptional regulator